MKIRIVNVYSSPSEDLTRVLDTLEQLTQQRITLPTLIVGDLNSNHQAWGGEISDEGGDKVIQYVINNALHILNEKEQGPTFQSNRGKSFIDLSLANHDFYREFAEWTILDIHRESDHRYILFSCFTTQPQAEKRLTAKREMRLIDLISHDQWINSLKHMEIDSVKQLDNIIQRLYKKLSDWIDKLSIPVIKNKKSIKWWNTELEIERK